MLTQERRNKRYSCKPSTYEKEDPFLSGIDFIELMSVKGYFRGLERAACVKKEMSANDLFEFNILD